MPEPIVSTNSLDDKKHDSLTGDVRSMTLSAELSNLYDACPFDHSGINADVTFLLTVICKEVLR